MKEVGPFKSVIFIFGFALRSRKKEPFPPLKSSEEAPPAKKGNRDSLCVLKTQTKFL